MFDSTTIQKDEGLVIKKSKGIFHVRTRDSVSICRISPRLYDRRTNKKENQDDGDLWVGSVNEKAMVNLVVVGDRVRMISLQKGMGMIVEVFPRQNHFARRDPYPGNHKLEQVIVANIDYVIPVFAAARPDPRFGMLDRYLAAVEALDLHAFVVITKLDLLGTLGLKSNEKLNQMVDLYRQIGYSVQLTSSISGLGIEQLREILHGKVSVFVGKSGVGKTALLNALEPGLGLRINQVGNGKVGKGKHTTTSAEMITTSFGANIIDSPGVREFGLPDLGEENPDWLFPEMRPYIGTCRFGLDCSHDEEPGCAIKSAVMAGKINPFRYRSYLRIREDA
jgi:ribosome biogenesis GTPase